MTKLNVIENSHDSTLLDLFCFVVSGLRDPKQQKYHTAHLMHKVKVIFAYFVDPVQSLHKQ